MDPNPLQVSRKKKKVDVFALLPDELVQEIFKNLPPNQLRYKLRFVCRRWFNLISDMTLLDHTLLILQKPTTQTHTHTLRLIDITQEKQLGLKIEHHHFSIPYNGVIKSWCHEYLLITDQNKSGSLYIFNLLTKTGSVLPPCSTTCGGHYSCKCGVALSYDEFKEVYKIVHVFMGPPVQCELLVLKTDDITRYEWSEWKKVNGPGYTGQREYYWDDPVSVNVGRYLHWDVHCPKYLISMDTVKERFRQIRVPFYPMNNNTRYSMVEMGGFLAVLHKVSVDQVNVWMLKDFQKSKWEKFYSISSWNHWGLHIYPGSVVTSVRSKRFVIFRKRGSDDDSTGLYSYDLKNRTMKRLEIDIAGDERCVVHSTTASFR